MAVSPRSFRVALYREHLDEASFLYEQRCRLLTDREVAWQDLRDFEDRLDAHIDALVSGGDLALELCRTLTQIATPSEIFVVVCVFCRRRYAEPIAQMWRSFDFADAEKVRALTDALALEFPDVWRTACEQALASGNERLVPILAEVSGFRRFPVADLIASRIASQPNLATPEVLTALSRMPPTLAAGRALAALCRHPSPQVRAAATKGLLYLGDREVARILYQQAEAEAWSHLVMAVGGERGAAVVLRRCLEGGYGTSDTTIALGLLGDVSVVRSIVASLESEELSESAAFALYWITGAVLVEDVFEPEVVDEAELFDDERQAHRATGTVPVRSDGEPYGTNRRRLTHDIGTWNAWLAKNAQRFDTRVRYRKGKPYGPRVLYECLVDQLASATLRQLAYEELAIHFGCTVPFENGMRVVDQLAALCAISDWLDTNETRFVERQGSFAPYVR